MPLNHQKAHIIAVDMGYGHQRAAYPLRELAPRHEVINANTYRGIPSADRAIWEQSRKVYEFFSRFKKFPVVGELAWDIFDKLQRIAPFYPKRDLSKPIIQLTSTYSLIQKKQWGKHLIDRLAKNPLPLISTFFIPAFMAEIFNYPGEIYCLATDTDISRAWAPLEPKKSRIKYFAPTHRVEERLGMYGVRPENIFVTGFPLPAELIGRDKAIVKRNLGRRLFNLDPQQNYLADHREMICRHLGQCNFPNNAQHPLTVMFAVGGAGAQRELGLTIALSLKKKIRDNKLHLILVAGIHNDVNNYFKSELHRHGLGAAIGKSIHIIHGGTKESYFKKFNRALKTTDILWTKPSELAFYTALGLPIIMSEPLGSQEKFNQKWLRTIGSGVNQEKAAFTGEWLFDWLDSGWFAEAAMQGFLEASTDGLANIHKIICHRAEKAVAVDKVLHY